MMLPVRPLFSDRAWPLKVLVSLSLFAWCCHASQERLGRELVEPEEVVLQPERVEGKACHGWARLVLEAEEDAVRIDTSSGPVRVEGVRAEPGSFVSFSGRAAGPRLIRADRYRVNAGYAWKRPLNYAVSAITVLVVAWSLRRRFRGRAAEGVVFGRY
jgi:hypothetical protein